MGEEIKNVQLRFSCAENWNEMPATAGGRHCGQCQKKVYDFTNTKAQEFQRILADNNYQVCGRFAPQQMHVQPVILPFWKKWVSAAMLLIGFHLSACDNKNQPIGKIKNDKKTITDHIKSATKARATTVADESPVIGKVAIEECNQKPRGIIPKFAPVESDLKPGVQKSKLVKGALSQY